MGSEHVGASELPGMGDKITSESREFLKNTTHVVVKGLRIDEDTQDSENDPVTKLRPGLVLIRVEDGPNEGKFVSASHADVPDDEDIVEAVILMGYHDMLGRDGVVHDQVAQGLEHGMVDESMIVWDTDDAGTIAALKDVMNLIKFS